MGSSWATLGGGRMVAPEALAGQRGARTQDGERLARGIPFPPGAPRPTSPSTSTSCPSTSPTCSERGRRSSVFAAVRGAESRELWASCSSRASRAREMRRGAKHGEKQRNGGERALLVSWHRRFVQNRPEVAEHCPKLHAQGEKMVVNTGFSGLRTRAFTEKQCPRAGGDETAHGTPAPPKIGDFLEIPYPEIEKILEFRSTMDALVFTTA